MSTVTIIAGGRDLPLYDYYYDWLDTLHRNYNLVEVVQGGANGADKLGKIWANNRNIKVTEFPALWRTHGKMAGPIRNREMAEYLARFERRLCILFPGGAGTASMKKYAILHKIEIEEYR